MTAATSGTRRKRRRPSTVRTIGQRLRLLRTLVFGVAVLALAGGVVRYTLAVGLADSWPELALVLNPGEPKALALLAAQGLETQRPEGGGADTNPGPASGSASDEGTIRKYAERALAADPLNGQPLRVLGMLAARAGDKHGAQSYMRAAVARNAHDAAAAHWLMLDAVDQGDYATAAHFADVLLRTDELAAPAVVPVLAHMAETDTAKAQIRKLLEADPPWRSAFFAHLTQSITDARTPLELFLAARDAGHPPSPDDIKRYLDFLYEHKLVEFAYSVWLQFLPPDELSTLGFVYNGDFMQDPSGSPFDWTLTDGAGSTATIENVANGPDRALYINFGLGRIDFRGVHQTLLLAPGRYRLTGQVMSSMRGNHGLWWTVSCLDQPAKPLGGVPMFKEEAAAWRPFELAFEVPSMACVGQSLRLELQAATLADHIINGEAWFNHLRIETVPVTK